MAKGLLVSLVCLLRILFTAHNEVQAFAPSVVVPTRSSASVFRAQSTSTPPPSSAPAEPPSPPPGPPYKHVMAILTMPYTSLDRIANEAILERVLPTTNKLSVVLRCDGATPSLACLRRYVGEIYSQLWDCAIGQQDPDIPDVVVYPQNLPNAAPESWITIQTDLDAVCSHDSIIGWVTQEANGRGTRFQSAAGQGVGGLDEHVAALNSERAGRKLAAVQALHVQDDSWPVGAAADDHVVFLDDDYDDDATAAVNGKGTSDARRGTDRDEPVNELLLGGARIPPNQIFDSVAVGGTFDGLHFGHRKLLTLAMSSVNPVTGRLLVGVTADEMLKKKENAEYIPCLKDRMDGVRAFLSRLSPGMMNRVKLVPISDSFGPPGQPDQHFDALVLSHETLETGYKLNQYRVKDLKIKPLYLLCTRRTEAHGMSSTALRRLRVLKGQDTPTPAVNK
jgi:cytidyltransferase-like protein